MLLIECFNLNFTIRHQNANKCVITMIIGFSNLKTLSYILYEFTAKYVQNDSNDNNNYGETLITVVVIIKSCGPILT